MSPLSKTIGPIPSPRGTAMRAAEAAAAAAAEAEAEAAAEEELLLGCL